MGVVGRAVGRRDEVERIVALLAEVRDGGPGRIVELTGQAGIGKSTVLAAVEAAGRQAGWRVWDAAPTAAESELPWTTLAQILDEVRDDDLGLLAEGQLHQLETVTSADRRGPVSPELVAFGLASLLDTAASGDAAPILLAVDDVQWMDRASAGAFAYALRGAAQRRAVVLLARRTDEPTPLEPSRLVDADTLLVIDLPGLSLASLREIVADATGATLTRAQSARLHQRTGGNPLYAIELARATTAGASPDTVQLPASLRDTVGARLHALPADTRRVLGAAAAAARPTTGLLAAALPDIDVLEALEPAEAAGIAVLRSAPAPGAPPVIAFCHPLLAAASIDVLTASERRRLHAALSEHVSDPVERVPHLLASGTARGEALAEMLAAAAREAAARGAVDTAVEYAEASLLATPARPRRTRLERRYALGTSQVDAGDMADGHSTLTDLIADLEAARVTGRRGDGGLDGLLGRTLTAAVIPTAVVEGFGAGVAAAWRALDVVSEPDLRRGLHAGMVRLAQFEDVDRGLEIAEAVFARKDDYTGAHAVYAEVQLLAARALAGRPVDLDATIDAVDTAGVDARQQAELRGMLVEPLVWTDDPRAVAFAEAEVAREEAAGFRPTLLIDLNMLGDARFVRGEWDSAEQAIRRAIDLAVDNAYTAVTRCDLAAILAGRGDTAGAAVLLGAVEAAYEREHPGPGPWLWFLARRGEVALTTGSATAADDLLAAERIAIDTGMRSVRVVRFRRSLVEALVAAGRLEEAAGAAERLATDAQGNQVATAIAESDAATAVVASALGDHEHARARFTAAIATQREYELRYELARTLLAAGTASRRANRRIEARGHLGEARELFGGMGAAMWVRRCDDETERLGDRRSEGPGDLTPTERQVADLVASGMTNAEVASTLFVSVRTIESNLTRVYRKLGIRSRTALADRLTRPAPS